MSRILLIDSNPENRKSLEGLLRYRTQHDVCVVENHTEGARKAVSLAPDLIMMNVLLFMGNNYAFPRVLQQHDKTKHISFLVQANGHLDEVTERQIQASGMANIVYLPVSADELDAAIQQAVGQPKTKGKSEVASVVWPVAGEAKKETELPAPEKTVEKNAPDVKPVAWPTVSQTEANKSKSAPTKKVSFQDFAKQEPRPKQKKQRSGFKAATFGQVSDKAKVKGAQKFRTQTWQTVDPKDVKKTE